MALCPLYGPLPLYIPLPLYGPVPPLWYPALPPPSMALCLLYNPVPYLQEMVFFLTVL
jgi:hypothetical protein